MSKLKLFELLDSGFTYDGATYADADISHIYYEPKVVRHFVNGQYSGNQNKTKLEVFMRDGKKLSFKASDLFAHNPNAKGWSHEERVEIEAIHRSLAARTLARRVKYYEDQLANTGHFYVNDWQMQPPDLLIHKGSVWRVAETSFQRNGPRIELRKKHESLVGKLGRKFAREISESLLPAIVIDRDVDAVDHMLSKHFKLRW